MMTIAESLSDLLYMHDTVVVPGLGALVKKTVPAHVDLETDLFSRPSSLVEFDAALREDNDMVVRYLMENNGMTEDEATKTLASFVEEVFNTIKSGKPFVLEGLGTLSLDSNGELTFAADESVNYNSDAFGLTDFTMPSVTPVKDTLVAAEEEEEEKEEIEKKKSAWYWALLAACVLIGGFFGLRQFGVFDKETKEPVAETEVPKKPVVVQPVIQDSLDVAQPEDDAHSATILPLTREVAETQYRVVAGCYDREDNALWFANVLRGAGFAEAFYEQRGERWFVSFASYATYDEALEALTQIRSNTNYQAWILVPKEQ